MANSRWKVFHFNHRVPEESAKKAENDISIGGHACGASLVLSNELIEFICNLTVKLIKLHGRN